MLTLLPDPASCESVVALDSYRSVNSTALESPWNHPYFILPPNPIHGKTAFHKKKKKKIPCAKNVGDHWCIGLTRLPTGSWVKWGIMNLLPTSPKHQDPALQNMPCPWEKVIPKEEGMLCTVGRVRNPTGEGINGIDLMEHPLHVTYVFFTFNFLFYLLISGCIVSSLPHASFSPVVASKGHSLGEVPTVAPSPASEHGF